MLHSPIVDLNNWLKLWISFENQDDLALKYLSGKFNGSEIEDRFPVIARQDGYGLCSIDCLDPDLIIGKSDANYYHEMINYLVSIGYMPGETLFGFPYDWRQSVRYEKTLFKLEQLISYLSQKSKEPVDIISHSMGGLLMKSYIAKNMEDCKNKIGLWTAIGTPWRGAGAIPYKAIISGYNLNMVNIPIIDWGLSERVAHAIELHWPSSYELLPDISSDPWWRAVGNNDPPMIMYQITGQPLTEAKTIDQVYEILMAINANQTFLFPNFPYPILNELNQIAWNYSMETKLILRMVELKLKEFRKNNPGSTFKVISIEGSQIPTKYSISYPIPVNNANQLQFDQPNYELTYGDQTVPYASAMSDGMEAIHYNYLGTFTHQNLIRAPEVFQTTRYSLGLSCILEGIWNVTIIDPYGKPFSNQQWKFNNSLSLLKPTNSNLYSADIFNTTLPDMTPIYGVLDTSCMQFIGYWYMSTYKSFGIRVMGNECKPMEIKTVKTCIYGFWSH